MTSATGASDIIAGVLVWRPCEITMFLPTLPPAPPVYDCNKLLCVPIVKNKDIGKMKMHEL